MQIIETCVQNYDDGAALKMLLAKCLRNQSVLKVALPKLFTIQILVSF